MRCVQRRACPRPLHLNLLPPPTPLINYLGSIAARFGGDENWGHEDAKGFADDLHRLAFGDELNLEKRGRAAVDLASEGVKFIGGDSYDDDDRKALDDSGRLIKEAIFGDSKSLSDTVSDILGD